MGTTNILDLNNRLEKVERGNVAQNSYTSLKNKPKINSVTLSGNKSLADIGAAAAADVGSLSALTTTDKSSCVGAINELKSGLINPVSGTIIVTLPANSTYGYYYFMFPSTAFALGKTVTIVGANFIGDSTELKDHISPETDNSTEIGRIYKISAADKTGVSAATYGNALLISYTVS